MAQATVASTDLPIEACLPELRQGLRSQDDVVLQAPPGAGKTTRVPLALLDEPWLAGRRILMLEPRRIAARTAAWRMAGQLGERPGETVGYRMRLDNKVGPRTRIEVITEGILTRMLQQDPALAGVGLVIFDEFHERHLDSDLGLALCLQGRELFAEPGAGDSDRLRILVMSATLDTAQLVSTLGNPAVVQSEGRSYPVDIVYGRARQRDERNNDRVIATVREALRDNPDSSLLVFLPGQGEIRYCSGQLSQWIRDERIEGVELFPLYGNLSIDEQQRAIAPVDGLRKVVLATNIAETSLTIEGVDVVVDCGLARVARFDPVTGMSGLQTVRISRASSEQRAGRAGRLRPGKCYRLWSSEQQQQLAAHADAEIVSADLAALALQLLQWGIDDPSELRWLDPPPPGPWQQALDLLHDLGATCRPGDGLVLSEHGAAMAGVPTHPRLAHLLLRGAACGHGRTAARLAALLSERDPVRDEPDIAHRLDLLDGGIVCPQPLKGWKSRILELAGQLERQLDKSVSKKQTVQALVDSARLPGYLLACAYPDRIARRRQSGGYQLANGRSAAFTGVHALGKERWLALAEVSVIAGGKGDRIFSAAALDHSLFETALEDRIETTSVAEWDRRQNRFVAETQQRIGALVLERRELDSVPIEARRAALIEYLRSEQLKPLKFNEAQRQWCARVELMRAFEPEAGWPDSSEQGLLDRLEDWLGPWLDPVSRLQDFGKLDIDAILSARLPWELGERLSQQAPLRLQVPSGSSIKIDYGSSPPVLAVKLQEMFGCLETPRIANGRVALLVHLLSPAGRPLQVTQDLAGFWASSYHEVKKDMKGRYPKHPWPDDPLTASPTRHTKARAGK